MNYIVERRNKIPRTEEDEKNAQRSWNRSVGSTKELIQYVRSLNPHSLASIKAMYSAEYTIGVLSKLVVGIFKDVDYLEYKKKEGEDPKDKISKNPERYAQLDSHSAVRAIEGTITEYENQMAMCKSETEEMLRTCAKLNNFVRQTALTATAHGDASKDDALSRSLHDKIENGKNARELTAFLKQIHCQYSQFLATERRTNNECNVPELIQQLYRLPMKGSHLRAAMEEENKARLKS